MIRYPWLRESRKLLPLCLALFSAGIVMAEENFVALDGFTSASQDRGLKVLGGKVYPTYAVIEWWDYYANGQVHELKWGTSESYGSTMNLKPFTRRTNVIDTIKLLEKNTKYYAAFHRTYTSKNKDITTKFEFTTPDENSTGINPGVTLRSRQLAAGEHAALFTLAGKPVAEASTKTPLTFSGAFRKKVAPGLYIARVMDRSNRPSPSFRCVIGE